MSAEPRTIGEAYSSATESSNLRAKADQGGDVDLLIAAGWVTDGLATSLYRLCAEFDSVKQEIGRADALTARLLVLINLKSLQSCADGVHAFALGQNALRSGREKVDVNRISRQVLDVMLDPTCHHCEGRGFNGGSHRGEPQVICRPCRGTGHRRDWIGKNEAERVFAAKLLALLQSRIAEVDKLMRRFLRQS